MDRKKLKPKQVIQIILAVALILLICMAVVWIKKHFFSDAGDFVEENVIGQEGKVTTVTQSTLEEVIKKSQLYTAEYPYNGYVTVYDEDGSIKYYVAYEGTVKAGIDVTRITVEIDENTDTITVRLPEVSVEDPFVNAGTMEFIFKKDKYNTETVAAEAYRYAEQDLADRVEEDTDIRACALESAKAAERALIEPWVNQIEAGRTYTVRVLGYGEEE